MDALKQVIPFENWDSFFASNPTIMVNAIIRASSYKGTKYVQLVPIAIKEIKLETFSENETELEVFHF
jgi:hypothetical protein